MIGYINTDLGTVRVETDGNNVIGVWFSDGVENDNGTDAILEKACTEINEYLNGQRQRFSVPLKFDGTDFERKVLSEICLIPYGETRTYSEIAELVGNPGAARAVGSVCAHNRILLMIPCHRVVRADRSIRGYSGGDERKRFLIDMEIKIRKAERD